MYNVRIAEVNHFAPDNIVSNEDLSKIIDTNDEWIVSRTGIKNRRITLGDNTSDLAYKACKDFNLDGIDLIVFATFTPDKMAPTTASILQKKLGIVNATCYDINAGCTGFIYALKTATALIQTGMHNKALVVGGEVISKVTEWSQRQTCVLFGDAAAAVVLERSEECTFKTFYTESKIDSEDVLFVEGVENSNPFHTGLPVKPLLKMDGVKVFKFAVGAMSDAIDKALERANLDIDEIKCIIPHQANERIIKSVSKGRNIPLNKFYMNIDSYGNTSSATIPLALSEAVKDGTIKRGDKVLLVAFGAGLTWGSTIFEF